MKYHNATYLSSAAKFHQLPKDRGIEIGFFGRSNVGKSSAINIILGKKNLTRVSKTPGRTQLIHLFQIDKYHKLVDLPGYGYAKVTEKVRLNWQRMLKIYLTKRKCLKGIILLIDSRHPIKISDKMMIQLAISSSLNLHILLTKVDKLGNFQSKNCKKQLQDHLHSIKTNISYQIFSSLKRIGVNKLKEILNSWYLSAHQGNDHSL